jgi:thiol:disulfide interchange protein DsbC
MKTAIIIVFLALLAPGTAPAQAQTTPFGSIRSVKSIPITGVKMIESDKGVFFVSENGRFAWKGPLYDIWNGKNIRTMEDVDTVVRHLDIKKIGLNPDQLAHLTLGKGGKEELIFVSPDCPHCRRMLQQAAKLTNQYTFKLLLLPMGPNSFKHVKQLMCAKDKQAAVQALVSGNFQGLNETQCDLGPLRHTLVATRILGLHSVPYLIRDDGKVETGELTDLAGWLAGKDDQPEKVPGTQKKAKGVF